MRFANKRKEQRIVWTAFQCLRSRKFQKKSFIDAYPSQKTVYKSKNDQGTRKRMTIGWYRGKNVISDTFLGLNRNLGPHLCHCQLQSREEALFPYDINFAIWEIPTVDFDAVRAMYAWNSSLFHYLHMFCKKNSFWSWCGDLFAAPLRTRGACKDPARV